MPDLAIDITEIRAGIAFVYFYWGCVGLIVLGMIARAAWTWKS